jgi:hypothetical protein
MKVGEGNTRIGGTWEWGIWGWWYVGQEDEDEDGVAESGRGRGI